MRQRRKKTLVGLLSITLFVVLSIGTTLAFLTDGQSIVNTFALGEIDIALEEPNYPQPEPGVIIPGDNFPKDPTVEGRLGDTYMRVIITLLENDENSENYQTVITDPERIEKILSTIYFDPENELRTGDGGKFAVADLAEIPHFNNVDFTKDEERSTDSRIVMNYNGIFTQGSVSTVFTTVIIPYDWNQSEMDILGKYQIVITTEAIQSDVFDDAEHAFDLLDREILEGTLAIDYKELKLSYLANE